MTPRRPTRATAEGRAYLDLQNLARRQHRPTDEFHQLYALEGFVSRLATSQYSDRFVLKGGVLLAAYDTRRPTRDVDLAGQAISADPDHVLDVVREIATIDLDDGLIFDPRTASSETIRDADAYSGVRVSLNATLATARLSLHIDVNVGDPISPPPQAVQLPKLLGGTLTVTGYPLSMILAEKIITALERGTTNTRWRDYADVYLLTRRHQIDGTDLTRALTAVAEHRQLATTSLTMTEVLDGYASSAQARWTAWRRKQLLDDRVPGSFAELLDHIQAFSERALNGSAAGHTWNPHSSTWATTTERA